MRDTRKLTEQEKYAAIMGIYNSAGLQVVFDIIEDIVTDTENALIGEDPEHEKTVVKLQYRAHAQRALFTRLTQEVDKIASAKAQAEEESPITLEERALASAEPPIN